MAVGLLAALAWFLYRRQKAKKMDADVVAAASAAAATTRTPFDDDDEDMAEAEHYPQSHSEAAPYHYSPEAAASQQYYESPGYHAPNHYASTELPRAFPAMADDPYASDIGSRQNAMEYYSNTSVGNGASERGAYSNVPSDSQFSYNQPLYESVPGAPPAVAGAAAAYQNPFQAPSEAYSEHSSVPQRVPTMQSAHASERTSTSNDYDIAPSQVSHASQYTAAPEFHDSALAYAEPAAAAPAAAAAPMAITTADQSADITRAAAPISPTGGAAYLGAPIDSAGPPSYVAGPSAPVVSDEKTASGVGRASEKSGAGFVPEPAQLVQFGHPSPDAQAGPKQPFSDHEGQSQADHGDWDPPALSSAWFPSGTHTQPSALSEAPVAQYPTHAVHRMSDVPEAETASVEHAPARLTVRNPSPEDNE